MTIFEYNGLKINSEKLRKEDMPTEIFEEIFEICGADVALSLLIKMSGNLIQVPTRGMQKIERKIIINDYDGTTASIRDIARRFNISEMYIRNILNESKIKTPSPNQESFKFIY